MPEKTGPVSYIPGPRLHNDQAPNLFTSSVLFLKNSFWIYSSEGNSATTSCRLFVCGLLWCQGWKIKLEGGTAWTQKNTWDALESHFLKKSQKDNLEVANKNYKQSSDKLLQGVIHLGEQEWYICWHMQRGRSCRPYNWKIFENKRKELVLFLDFSYFVTKHTTNLF